MQAKATAIDRLWTATEEPTAEVAAETDETPVAEVAVEADTEAAVEMDEAPAAEDVEGEAEADG